MATERPVGRTLRALGSTVLALAVGGGLLSDTPALTPMRGPGGITPGVSDWFTAAATIALMSPVRPIVDALDGSQAISAGKDGRLTVLLLGSDTRAGGVGLTDTIMIMSLKNGMINAASIPRDTGKILNPFTAAPDDIFKGRINAVLKKLKSTTSNIHEALKKFEIVIESVLQIEIDYYAMVTFRAFEILVDQVDPIRVNVRRTVKDPKFWDDPTKTRGVYFPAADDYVLEAARSGPLCNGLWKNYATPPPKTWCHRALPFVRSRKGSGNNDFIRARRQQDFVGATIRHVKSGHVAALVSAAGALGSGGGLHTNIPFNTSSMEFFNRLAGATMGKQVVFKPKTYASRVPGTTMYRLKLSAVRGWAAQNLK